MESSVGRLLVHRIPDSASGRRLVARTAQAQIEHSDRPGVSEAAATADRKASVSDHQTGTPALQQHQHQHQHCLHRRRCYPAATVTSRDGTTSLHQGSAPCKIVPGTVIALQPRRVEGATGSGRPAVAQNTAVTTASPAGRTAGIRIRRWRCHSPVRNRSVLNGVA